MRIMRETGLTKQQLHRARKLSELTDEEFEARLQQRTQRRRR
jgi:hypothetical protein